jgi:FlaA1/EpsC-like NDP-sugar epimerase
MSSSSRLDLADPILALPRPVKRLLVLATDIALCVLTVWLAFFLRLDEWVRMYNDPFWRGDWAAAIAVLVAIPLFITHGFYRVIFRHANLIALSMVLRAFALYWVIYAGIITVIGVPGVPRTVGVIQPLLLMVAVGLSRGLAHYWLGGAYQRIWRRASLPKAVIYGAGEAGRQLSLAMVNNPELRVIGFLDDDPSLQGQFINGHKVHKPQALEALAASQAISTVLLALPSISRHRRNQILAIIKQAKVAVRTLPSVTDLAQGKVTVSDLRELDIEDLLGRDPVTPVQTLLDKNIRNKVVMVTGAGGSIGSELCRQIVDLEPQTLVLFEQSEYALYRVEAELTRRLSGKSTQLVSLLGSVQDEALINEVMGKLKPNTLYHAAAYKHVPLVEHNPTEGIKNNVFGTLTTAQAAIAAGVDDFVLISTDKAVRPTNIMGASKRLAEMVLQALAADSIHTRLTMVRFGNVLGSSGSVVPKFRQQIRDGGPVTVTDLEVTRYFMTLSEAAELVIQAGAMSQGGDVFVLDMGQPVKIFDLARRMIELSGLSVKDELNPDGDIAIETTGLRAGEKLYEELLIGENPEPTPHPRIMRASEEFLTWPALKQALDALEAQLQARDATQIKPALQRLVAGYVPQNERQAGSS